MNVKTVTKMIFLTLIGAVFGFIISKGLLQFNDSKNIEIVTKMGDFFVNNSLALFFLLLIILFIPSIYMFLKGKKIYSKLDNMEDDEYDVQIKVGQKNFEKTLALNSIFLIFNFMLLGMTFSNLPDNEMINISVFMLNIFAASMLEIITVRFIQKADTRLKGDPTSLRFSKDYLGSCDEAEKLKIYKTGYHAFQVSKMGSLGFVLLTILCNFILDTGGFPVFVSCSLMLVNIASYSYYAIYKS